MTRQPTITRAEEAEYRKAQDAFFGNKDAFCDWLRSKFPVAESDEGRGPQMDPISQAIAELAVGMWRLTAAISASSATGMEKRSEEAQQRGLPRSEPGKGEEVNIFALGSEPTTIAVNHGEDFAETRWPVVVKVKRGVSRRDVVRHLRDLADSVVDGSVVLAEEEDDDIPF